MQYYDPMFYLCSEEMPFSIRIEVTLREKVEPELLDEAVQKAIRRFPYFAVRPVREGGEIIPVKNENPIPVYAGDGSRALGSPENGFHVNTVAYEECTIHFSMTHVLCDGAGYFPFIKSVLYEYLCKKTGKSLSVPNVLTEDVPFFPDETGNPFPDELLDRAEAYLPENERDFFRLKDGGYVTDHTPTVFRFRVPTGNLMAFSHDHDGSPCALLSSLLAEAVWKVHPEEEKDLLSAVSFNLRPGLGNRSSYRMLCNYLPLRYPNRLKGRPIDRICTCTRGMITVQSQPENVLWYAKNLRARMRALETLPTVEEKTRLLQKEALADASANTYSISYVGKLGLGEMEPYLASIYNLTDGSTYETAFLEVSAVGDTFDLSLLQGFSSDVYYRALLDILKSHALPYEEDFSGAMNTPKIVLP